MMCKNGLAKIADLGLAAFSARRDKDPWTEEIKLNKNDQPVGVLCAQFRGGTPAYFSPQQVEVEEHNKKKQKKTVQDARFLTVATSDLYQAAMTIVEMHARKRPSLGASDGDKPSKVLKWAAISKTLESEFERFSPEQVGVWVKETNPQFDVCPLVDKRIGGKKLLELVRTHTSMEQLRIKLGLQNVKRAKTLKTQIIKRYLHTNKSTEMRDDIKMLLQASFAEEVRDRPATIADALRILGANDEWDKFDVSCAELWDLLPNDAKLDSNDHEPETVESTFRGLVRKLEPDDKDHALVVCSEWLGVAATDDGRGRAFKEYCRLWERHGPQLSRKVDLSRKARGHWKEEMLRGSKERIIVNLIQSLSCNVEVSPQMESIGLAEQRELQGPVLEMLPLNTLTNLHTLPLQNCRKLEPGPIPSTIGCCVKLRDLNLSHCNRTGRNPLPQNLSSSIC